ncbi:MAG: hypothetical protein JXA92_08650 [candidate division Zixibacteria bacterium]|nr:hypothetical protein [candidate division Zixibacteria bacterium]
MALTAVFYEDEKYKNFYPLTHLRPVYTLRAGILPLFRRVERVMDLSGLTFLTRHQLAALTAEQYRDYPVNIIKKGAGEVLFINGRVRSYGDLPTLIKNTKLSTIFKNNGETVAVLFQQEALEHIPTVATVEEYIKEIQNSGGSVPDFETTATLYGYGWELVEDIEKEIIADFQYMKVSGSETGGAKVHGGAHILNEKDVFLCSDVEILPGAVIDASRGPVYIGANTRVESLAAVYGPAFIGANSVVLAGKITASSIGHTCRVGGEVEESVFQAYVNKYHAGFIGHSYVGPWVNFGAMTTNSDLKNNYSDIRVMLNGQLVDTGSIKVGSFIGDHTKFGIGTLLNTGINIGVCCNIFGGSLIVEKEVPSFHWGNSQGYDTYRFDKAVETAQRTARRRNCTLSEREIEMLKHVFDNTADREGVVEF